jgi:hypothetical protein
MAPKKQNRMAKCREMKKTDPEVWEEYLQKDRERNKARRAVNKTRILSNPKLLKETREKERLRKRAARERKKQANVTPTAENSSRLGTYKCTHTLRKAVKKLKQSLPYSVQPFQKSGSYKRIFKRH